MNRGNIQGSLTYFANMYNCFKWIYSLALEYLSSIIAGMLGGYFGGVIGGSIELWLAKYDIISSTFDSTELLKKERLEALVKLVFFLAVFTMLVFLLILLIIRYKELLNTTRTKGIIVIHILKLLSVAILVSFGIYTLTFNCKLNNTALILANGLRTIRDLFIIAFSSIFLSFPREIKPNIVLANIPTVFFSYAILKIFYSYYL